MGTCKDCWDTINYTVSVCGGGGTSILNVQLMMAVVYIYVAVNLFGVVSINLGVVVQRVCSSV